MIRNQTEVKVDENWRWKVSIKDMPTAPGSPESSLRQHLFLQELAEQQNLLQCGPLKYQKMTIWHDGNGWGCECVALGVKP
jgi:hypothetical protein